MRLILIFAIAIVQMSSAQNYDFETQNVSNSLNAEITLIEKSEYQQIKDVPKEFIELAIISEQNLTKKYPEIFRLKDSCYLFSANLNKTLEIKAIDVKVCKNKIQTKEHSDDTIKGVYCGYALIETIWYEYWGFLSVDLEDGSTFFKMGKPLTANGETAISYSNYYGEEEIAMTDLKTKEQYVIGIQDWRTKESKVSGNSYYLKLESQFHSDCTKEVTYLKLELKN
ncbi:hypothetical protein ES692_13125 [Psychroserpens burtonensis]|uniref:PI-PLC Y-box domain-containing protein n=1 Tax=Psychroserpens burtonensis TaxID=49278 RepID=A0A5C7B599_9FLAO|nr:hypothetical protein [Psychroserpens burtonensis]TXE16266.1 hypothetical protein ES692_13125 [Psychroserpens burtonensis]